MDSRVSGGDLRVQGHAVLDPVVQTHFPLDDDQGAQAPLAQRCHRSRISCSSGISSSVANRPKPRRRPEVGQGRAQFRLEDDDEGDHPDGLQGADDPADDDHAQAAGHEGQHQQEAQPHEHLDDPRVLDEHDQAIEQVRHDEDIEEVDEEAVGDDFPHDGAKLASRGALLNLKVVSKHALLSAMASRYSRNWTDAATS